MLPLQSSKENVICINNLGIWKGSNLIADFLIYITTLSGLWWGSVITDGFSFDSANENIICFLESNKNHRSLFEDFTCAL